MQAVLDDFERAPIDDKLRATLAFLKKVTIDPKAVGPADAAAALRAGVTPTALRDAVYVCAAFNVMDRVADALSFRVPDRATFNRAARFLIKLGYDL